MSSQSQHEDYRIFHSTVNAQNRSNYELKNQLIRQIPLGIIAISSLYNFFLKDNWHWLIGLFSLMTIISALITWLLHYFVLEYAISTNMQWEKIASEDKDNPPDEQSGKEPIDKKKYDDFNKYVCWAYTTSIVLCILLTVTIGGFQMAAKRTYHQTTEDRQQGDKHEGGIVSRPPTPEGRKPAPTTPAPEQPERQPAPSSNPKPEPPKSESQPVEDSK